MTRVSVNGQRQRVALAMLLNSPDRIVSVDSLVEAIWNGQPPTTSRTQVAICVTGLRKAFRAAGCLGEVIATAPRGYMLTTRGHRLDTLEFNDGMSTARDLARRGEHVQAVTVLEAALALWRGPALDGLSGTSIEAEAARLNELRLSAYSQYADLKLTLGEYHDIIPLLTASVQEHPLRESVRLQLMTAQYRSGRRAESLSTFREGRRRHIEELGLEPGPELQQLHDLILQDIPVTGGPSTPPALAAHAPVAEDLAMPSQVPSAAPDFTGREKELADIATFIGADADPSYPALVLITGGPGVGKTSLAVKAAWAFERQFPQGQLFADLRGYDSQHTPATSHSAAERLVRALAVPNTQIPSDFHDLLAVYHSLIENRRILIVLDNMSSFAQIEPLLPVRGPCCVIITARRQSAALLAEHRVLRLRLSALDDHEATELLRHVVDPAQVGSDPRDIERLAQLCDRLPLALQLAAAQLATKPHWTIAHLNARLEDCHRRLDRLGQSERSIRASLDLSYQSLLPEVALLYRQLGLHAAQVFTDHWAESTPQIGTPDVEDLLEQLVDAHLLEASVDSGGELHYQFQRLTFLHARERGLADGADDHGDSASVRARRLWLGHADSDLDDLTARLPDGVVNVRTNRWVQAPCRTA